MIWLLILGLNLLSFIHLLGPFLGRSPGWGDISALSLMLTLSLLSASAFLATLRLHLRITDEDIFYRFEPFHRHERRIPMVVIKHYTIRRLNHRAELGVLGSRPIRGGRAYALGEAFCLEIHTFSGGRYILSTRYPGTLQAAMDAAAPVEGTIEYPAGDHLEETG
jgi:hypothetical protein